jgi:hypothetical protein
MADTTVDDRRANRDKNAQIARQSKIHEALALRRYVQLGYIVISANDLDTREAFDMPAEGGAADLVVSGKPGKCLVAEVKGLSGIAAGIKQLENTLVHVGRRFTEVVPVLLLPYNGPGDEVQLPGNYQAKRDTRTTYGAYILYANHQPVSIGKGHHLTIEFV